MSEPMTVRIVHEPAPLPTGDLSAFLLERIKAAGYTCLCRGRGQIDDGYTADRVCPWCDGSGVAA